MRGEGEYVGVVLAAAQHERKLGGNVLNYWQPVRAVVPFGVWYARVTTQFAAPCGVAACTVCMQG